MSKRKRPFDAWVAAIGERDYTLAQTLHREMEQELTEGETQALSKLDYEGAKRFKDERDHLEQKLKDHLGRNPFGTSPPSVEATTVQQTTTVLTATVPPPPPSVTQQTTVPPPTPSVTQQTTTVPQRAEFTKNCQVVLRGTKKYDGSQGLLVEEGQDRAVVRLQAEEKNVSVPLSKLKLVEVVDLTSTENASGVAATPVATPSDEWRVDEVSRKIDGQDVDQDDRQLIEKIVKMKALADNEGATQAESVRALGRYMSHLAKVGLGKDTTFEQDIALATLQIPITTPSGTRRPFSIEHWMPIAGIVTRKMNVNYYRDQNNPQNHVLCVYGDFEAVVMCANILVSVLNMLEDGAKKYSGAAKKSYKEGFVNGVRNAMDDRAFRDRLSNNASDNKVARDEISAYLDETGDETEEYHALVLRAQDEVARRSECLRRMQKKNDESLKVLMPGLRLQSSRRSSASSSPPP